MARIVMKFGGTSMAGIERIRSVAARIKREIEAGNQVAVVVSAMAGETDWQRPIRTSDGHGAARIAEIDTASLDASLAAGEVAVIPGFQGVAVGERVTTLGRGGSDTSAVAMAAAMKADRCDIYTDVDGVYTTDPRIVPRARKLRLVTYEEML